MRLILVSFAWALGISFARHLIRDEPVCWLFLGLALGIVIAQMLGRRWLWMLTLAAAFTFGALRFAALPQSSDIARHNGSNGSISGIVADEPLLRRDRLRFRLDVDRAFFDNQERESSGIVLVETSERIQLAYGDRVRATGSLAQAETWDTFSYADYLARQGIFSIMRHAGVEVTGQGFGSPIMAGLLRVKDIARQQIKQALPEPQAGLLVGILLGDESGIAPKLREDFQRVGAAHIIAISGFNMVVISSIVLRVFGGAGSRRTPATIAAIVVIVLYSLLAGASGGILRAALMSVLLVVGQQLRRKTFLPASLAFATLLLSLLDPNTLLDVGFQLSFCAVLGLGLFADPMSRRMRLLLEARLSPAQVDFAQRALNEPLIVSVAAQIATLPLALLYFGRLSLVALPVNLLIVPLQSVILTLGILATALSLVLPFIGAIAFWVEMAFLSWIIGVVRGYASWEYADIAFHVDPRLIQAGYLLLFGGGVLYAARPKVMNRLADLARKSGVVLSLLGGAMALLILLGGMALSRGDGKLRLWLLDIGHSNAILLQTPGGAQMLIDGGRYPARLLTAIGDRLPWHDRKIELLAITHPDAWDIAALPSLLDRYAIGALLYHGQENQSPEHLEILRRIATSEARQITIRAGHRIEFEDGVLIEALHPFQRPEAAAPLHDHVMVLRVSYGDVSFLLTSDLSRAGQNALLESESDLRATVLQLPQHASRRSLESGFLSAVQPQVVLLQSEAANRRGDPHPDTLAQLKGFRDTGRLYRTDEMGTIELISDGETVEIVGER